MEYLNETPKRANGEFVQAKTSSIMDFDFSNIDANGVGQDLERIEKQFKGNVFPYEVFPDQVIKIIKETNRCLGFPIDFIGTALLYTASAAMGNTYKIQVKNGRVESAVLFFALVGYPGSNKTHPLNFAVAPIRKKDEVSNRRYDEQKREYDKLVSMTKKERDGAGEPIAPVLRKTLLSDFTPESLCHVHKYNPRGIGVCIDELVGWLNNFNRYNKGSEEQFWLSTWSALTISIVRKTSDPIYVSSPFIPVIGTIQTGILNELAKDQRGKNGFLDRILFAKPDNLERPYWSDEELDQTYIDNWELIINNLLSIPLILDENLNPKPKILKLSPAAKEAFVTWSDNNVRQILKSKGDEAAQGVYSKLENVVCRIALILEVLSYGCEMKEPENISCKSIEGAIRLAEYFRVTALQVQDVLYSKDPLDDSPENVQHLFEELPNTFTTSEGVTIAEGLEIPERTFKRLLRRTDLFKCLKRGVYSKNT